MFKQILSAIALITLYLAFVSPPAEVLPYDSYQPAANFSAYIKLNRFSQIQYTTSSELTAPEDLDIDFDNGDIYVGNSNGTIFRIKSDKSRQVFLQSTGPVLRVELDKQHNKITFLDLYRGICKADLTNKQIITLVPFQNYGSLNSFDIAKDGKIYFTQISSRFAFKQVTLAMLSARYDGNVYVYDPATNSTQKLIDRLYCPNGIQVSPNGQHLYIAEMGKYRILKFNFKTGRTQFLIQNLEAVPDNLRFNKQGQLWIALPIFRDSFQDFLSQNTWVRTQLSKISSSILDKFAKSKYVGALKINQKGQILDYIKQSSSLIPSLSTALQYNGELYLGSFSNPGFAVIPIINKSSKESNSENKQKEQSQL